MDTDIPGDPDGAGLAPLLPEALKPRKLGIEDLPEAQALIDKWAPRLGVRDIRISLSLSHVGEDTHMPGSLASIVTQPWRNLATIYVQEGAEMGPPDTLEMAIVHEILHVATAQMLEYVDSCSESQPEIARAYRHMLEPAIDRITMALISGRCSCSH